ncbi:Hypothetical protein NTJ_15325 [Nesidiocoris tenuis]|uniref:Uncharacterized protein n=1 Tax=Nesidiocoris tenuis TaxID=355587 RepID=A0ABN7BDQ3_9HEMI|nr:Hypothetical protein NTJ_15325 [Nesidiocoris tenuis]
MTGPVHLETRSRLNPVRSSSTQVARSSTGDSVTHRLSAEDEEASWRAFFNGYPMATTKYSKTTAIPE